MNDESHVEHPLGHDLHVLVLLSYLYPLMQVVQVPADVQSWQLAIIAEHDVHVVEFKIYALLQRVQVVEELHC